MLSGFAEGVFEVDLSEAAFFTQWPCWYAGRGMGIILLGQFFVLFSIYTLIVAKDSNYTLGSVRPHVRFMFDIEATHRRDGPRDT